MTRELREKIAKLLWERFGFPEGQAAWHSPGLDVADRILALLPPQPKLEWREHDEWGAAYFHIGDLRIGEIRKDGGVWHAWAGGFRHGFYEDRDVAKRAVEEAVRKALGWAE